MLITIHERMTSRETQSFKQYLKDVSNIPLFTPEEQQLCTEKASRGDKEAINELIERNLRFVISVAKQYVNSNNTLEDLVNEGNIGLIIAVEHFKPEMGFKFISYAVWWIRKVILEYLAKNGRFIRLPANKINDLSKMEKNIAKLEQKLGRPADIVEIVNEFGDQINKEDTVLLKALSSFNMDSLDREISVDNHSTDNVTTLLDIIPDKSCREADHLIVDENVKTEIESILSTLKPRDRRIIIASFGLDGKSPRNLHEIGVEENLSREMIRQIKNKTLSALKSKLKNNTIRSSQ